MRSYRNTILVWPLSLILLLTLWACGAQDPVQKVLNTRSEYTVEQASFLPQRVVPEPVAEMVPEEGAEASAEAAESAAAAEEAGIGEEGEAIDETGEMVSTPVSTSILFDVILTFAGIEPLPGITLDIVHKDPFDTVKETRQHYIETPGLFKGEVLQEGFVLDDFAFEEGDTFAVEIRGDIPAAEQGDYREFAGL